MPPISATTVSITRAAMSSDSAAAEPSPCPSWSACGAYDGGDTDAGREAHGILEGSRSSDNCAQGRIPHAADGAVADATTLKLGSRSIQAIPAGLQCDWQRGICGTCKRPASLELGTSMMSTVCSSSSPLPMPPSTTLFALAPPVSEQSSIAASSFTSASAAPTAASVTGDASPTSGSHKLPEDPSPPVDARNSLSFSGDRLLPFRNGLGDLTV